MHVGNNNFSFITENLRIYKIFPMKIIIFEKNEKSQGHFSQK